MAIRKIVKIDEQNCNGCGKCIPLCAEGAIQIMNGKAVLVSDAYCDGLGACIGHCPKEAIHIIDREALKFDKEAVREHLASQKRLPITRKSALKNWPIQLKLTPLEAPFLDDCNLLVVADCVPVAMSDLHGSLLSERSVVMGCPKLDDAQGYANKLGEILKRNRVKSITVAHMEVPCCSGLIWITKKAIEASGKPIPLERYVITIGGEYK